MAIGAGADPMQRLTEGISKACCGLDGIAWNILGQTYVPKAVSESSFSWHATFPPGTFVPPHIHPTQDEFIYMFEGRFDLVLDGKDVIAAAGDLIRMPMGLPHGIFNKSRSEERRVGKEGRAGSVPQSSTRKRTMAAARRCAE